MSRIHTSKTQIMITKINPDSMPCFNILDNVIECKPSISSLGVIIDSGLSLDKQIASVCKSSYYYLHLISKKKDLLTINAIKTAVETLVLSRLNYCCTIYQDLPNYLIKKLQLVQNSSARLISGRKKFDPISDIIKSYKWLNVNNFVLYRNACIVYKCLCDIMPQYLTNMLCFVPAEEHILRSYSQFKLRITTCRTNFGERAFIVSASKIWNTLPDNIKFSPTYGVFKSKLRKHLLQFQS